MKHIVTIMLLAFSLIFSGCEKKITKSGPELFEEAEKTAKERLDKHIKDGGKPQDIADAARHLEIISSARAKAVEDYNATIRTADLNMTTAAQNAAIRAGVTQPTQEQPAKNRPVMPATAAALP